MGRLDRADSAGIRRRSAPDAPDADRGTSAYAESPAYAEVDLHAEQVVAVPQRPERGVPTRSNPQMRANRASGSASGLGRLLSEKVVCGNPEGVGVGPVSVDRHHSVDQIEWGRASTQCSFEVGNVSATLLNLALRIIVYCLRMPVASDDRVRAEACDCIERAFPAGP